jgi:hypothetical protein
MLLLFSSWCLHKLNSSSSFCTERSPLSGATYQTPRRRDAPVSARLFRGDQVALLAAAAIS